jgi:hypothetical protein
VRRPTEILVSNSFAREPLTAKRVGCDVVCPQKSHDRLRWRSRVCFSCVYLAQKWAPERTPSSGFSFPPDDEEELRRGRGKRVSRPPATKRAILCANLRSSSPDVAGLRDHADQPPPARRPFKPCNLREADEPATFRTNVADSVSSLPSPPRSASRGTRCPLAFSTRTEWRSDLSKQ